MTQKEYEHLKKIKAEEGKILMKICENYSMKIQLAIDKLIRERESKARCHYDMFQKASDGITEYENQLLNEQVRAEIDELTRC